MRDILNQVLDFLTTPAASIALIITVIWVFLYSRIFRKFLLTENYYARLFIAGFAVISSALLYLASFFYLRSVI